MNIFIPCSTDLNAEVIASVKSVFPDGNIFITADEQANIDEAIGKVARHKNYQRLSGLTPFKQRIWYYYNHILSNLVLFAKDLPEDDEVLLIHENIIINDSVKKLFGFLYDNVFSSCAVRLMPISHSKDWSDRCVAFKAKDFIKYHTLPNTHKDLEEYTTTEFIMRHIEKEGLKYIYREDVKVQEIQHGGY